MEIEAKNLLTEAEFNKLLTVFSIQQEEFISQSNHYFETKDLALKKNNCALRIREKEGKFTLTLKQQRENAVLETHQRLSLAEKNKLIEGEELVEGEVKAELTRLKIDLSTLAFLGTLKTERVEIDYKNGLLVFDKSYYFNCIDYELEYEGASFDTVWANFKDLLATHHIPIREMKHKIARFFAAKEKQRRSFSE